MSSDKEIAQNLAEPFQAHEIEWRINRCGIKDNNAWATAIPYITSRAVQDRLDSVFGLSGWQNQLKQVSTKGFLSGIRFKVGDEWLERWDGAEGSDSNNMDVVKSGASNALKRAAVLMGIGRYLYDLDEFFVQCGVVQSYRSEYEFVHKSKRDNKLIGWNAPDLPPIALPGFNINQYLKDMELSINNDELDKAFKIVRKAAGIHSDKNAINQAIEIGKSKRKEFNNAAALSIQKDSQEIEGWLNRQLAGFDLVPNVTAVNSVKEALLAELTKRIKNTLVDPTRFTEQINSKHEARIEKIKTEQNNQNKDA